MVAEDVKIKFLGHAGLLFNYNGLKLVCDPWFSDTGAFLGTWHQYPPNNFIDVNEIYDADFLYLSHDHQDHFDKPFLDKMPKEKVKVLISDFHTDSFYNELIEMGFNVVKLKDWHYFDLGPDFKLFLLQHPLFYVDSAIFVQAGQRKFFNRNDCNLPRSFLKKLRRYKIDILFCQHSGAMHYPVCYNYKPDVMSEKSAEIRSNLADRFIDFTNEINPKAAVGGFAGPPAFLLDDKIEINTSKDTIFPDQNAVKDIFKEKLSCDFLDILPGDIITFDEDKMIIDKVKDFNFAKKAEFISNYAEERKLAISSLFPEKGMFDSSLIESFKQYLHNLFSSSSYLCSLVNCSIQFILEDIQDNVYIVFNDSKPEFVNFKNDSKPNYVFSFKSDMAKMLVEEKITFEQLFLSLRLSIMRDPDIYNWPLFALLRYGHEPEAIKIIENEIQKCQDSFIDVKSGGKTFSIQKFCPHAGEDLSTASIEDGILICPRHHWKFDLDNCGKCLNGNLDLQVKEIKDDDTIEDGILLKSLDEM